MLKEFISNYFIKILFNGRALTISLVDLIDESK